MANAIWPVTLPQDPLVDGFGEMPPNTTIRTDTDSGPAKVRRRFTAGVRPLDVRFLLTKAQVEIFDGFYRDSLADGSLPYDWKHPRTNAAGTLRIVGQPKYDPAGSDLNYILSMKVELLP